MGDFTKLGPQDSVEFNGRFADGDFLASLGIGGSCLSAYTACQNDATGQPVSQSSGPLPWLPNVSMLPALGPELARQRLAVGVHVVEHEVLAGQPPVHRGPRPGPRGQARSELVEGGERVVLHVDGLACAVSQLGC